MIDVFIWGAGGHGKVVCDCAVAAGYRPAFLDDDPVAWLSQEGARVLNGRPPGEHARGGDDDRWLPARLLDDVEPVVDGLDFEEVLPR